MSKQEKPPLYIKLIDTPDSALFWWELMTRAGTVLAFSVCYERRGNRNRAARRVADALGLTTFGGD